MTIAPRRRTVLGAARATLPVLGLAACGEVTVEGEADAAEQLTIIDDQEREIVLPRAARTAVVLNSYTNEFLRAIGAGDRVVRSEEHTSELQSRFDIVCRLLLEKKKQ